MINGEYVIRNLVFLVIWYRQYNSVAELIFFFHHLKGVVEALGKPLGQHLL